MRPLRAGNGARRGEPGRAAWIVSASMLLGAFALAGCQGVSPSVATSPVLGMKEEASPGGIRRTDVQPVVPSIQHLFARSNDTSFMLVAQYDGIGALRLPPFSPNAPGGWCFQLFLDVDGEATGTPAGLDYVLRSMEIDAQGRAVLRRTEAGTAPGGWGEAVALVSVGASSRQLTLTIPLEVLGPDDGQMRFVLEFYESVPGGEGEAVVVHRFVVNYEGESTTGMEPRPLVAYRGGAVAPRASREP